MVLGEMDVARAKPKTPATRDASLHSAAAAYCRAGSPGPPRPGGRRPPGPEHVGRWGTGDDVWRGQTDGSVLIYIGNFINEANSRYYFAYSFMFVYLLYFQFIFNICVVCMVYKTRIKKS